MSGGNFDYAQHKIRDIYEEIENEIKRGISSSPLAKKI